MDTYYIVGFIALIVATLLFVLYINVINMDLVMDDHEDRDDEDKSVEYVIVDRGQHKHKNKKNKKSNYDEKDLRIDEYDQGKEYTYENRDDDPNNPYNNAYSPETIAMRKEQLKKQGDLMKKKLLTKKDDGFLDYMNDLTIKSKGLKTDAMNISNLV